MAKTSTKSTATKTFPQRTDPAQTFDPLRWLGPGLIFLAIVAMLCFTWSRWADVLVDFGRELYVPWRLTEGQALYRDIAYFNGPLSPYLNALWFKLFGVSIWTLQGVNIVGVFLLVALLYRLLTILGDRLSATVACVFFILVFPFSQYAPFSVFNYVAPYSHEMIHGALLAIASIYCLWLYLSREKIVYLGLAGLGIGLVFLTKPEIFLAVAPAVMLGTALRLWSQRAPRRAWLSAGGLLAAGLALPFLLAVLLLCLAIPPGVAFRGALGSWKWLGETQLTGMRFYQDLAGLSEVSTNLEDMAAHVGWIALTLGPAAVLGLLLGSRRHSMRRLHPYRRPLAAATGLIVLAVLLWRWDQIIWISTTLPLPALLGGVGAVLLVRVVRQIQARCGRVEPRTLLHLVFIIFAGLLLAKIVLNVQLRVYGFVLAMPAMLLAISLLMYWGPRLIERFGGDGWPLRAAVLASLMVWSYYNLRDTAWFLSPRQALVSNGVDSLYAPKVRGELVQMLMNKMQQPVPPLMRPLVPPEATLAVLPEGVMLNYLMRRVNPTPYINFMPPELIMFSEEAMLAAYQSHPPDYIILAHKSTEEYGVHYFGKDYGQKLYGWITDNYQLQGRIGPAPFVEDDQFGLILLRRKGPAEVRD